MPSLRRRALTPHVTAAASSSNPLRPHRRSSSPAPRPAREDLECWFRWIQRQVLSPPRTDGTRIESHAVQSMRPVVPSASQREFENPQTTNMMPMAEHAMPRTRQTKRLPGSPRPSDTLNMNSSSTKSGCHSTSTDLWRQMQLKREATELPAPDGPLTDHLASSILTVRRFAAADRRAAPGERSLPSGHAALTASSSNPSEKISPVPNGTEV